MKVLVIGNGGREHALVWKIAQSSIVDRIYAAPGNPGIEELAECIPIKPEDMAALIKFAKSVDVTIVGPENPLANGIVNELPDKKIFGPTKEAANIEADKSFAKEIMKKAKIPTAQFETFNKLDDAANFIYNSKIKYPVVIKASGLAAGKGVIIVNNQKEATMTLNDIMSNKIFGKSGDKVIIEDFLRGEEVSVLVFTDGKDFIPLIPAKDHKRLLDNDEGPNTGGMGAYARAVLKKVEVENTIDKIFAPCIRELKKEGIIYKGVLYAGLMITDNGPQVLEFNCRFGDPETQPIMTLLGSDLMEPVLATIEENLKSVSLKWSDEYSICVVTASKGYPGTYEKGKEITGLDTLKDAVAFHAGTAKQGDKVVTSGGRVLGITGTGETLQFARDKVYAEISKIYFDGMQYRRDITHKSTPLFI